MANKRSGLYFSEEELKLLHKIMSTNSDLDLKESKLFEKVTKKLYGQADNNAS